MAKNQIKKLYISYFFFFVLLIVFIEKYVDEFTKKASSVLETGILTSVGQAATKTSCD